MRLFDTNLIIYLAQGKLAEIVPGKPVLVSAISRLEALGHPQITVREASYIQALLATFEEIEVSPDVITKAIELRQQRRMSLGDAIIAATALLYKCELWTANSDDFKHIATLKLHNPSLQ